MSRHHVSPAVLTCSYSCSASLCLLYAVPCKPFHVSTVRGVYADILVVSSLWLALFKTSGFGAASPAKVQFDLAKSRHEYTTLTISTTSTNVQRPFHDPSTLTRKTIFITLTTKYEFSTKRLFTPKHISVPSTTGSFTHFCTAQTSALQSFLHH